jgi:vancomycin permeability regulator SanA
VRVGVRVLVAALVLPLLLIAGVVGRGLDDRLAPADVIVVPGSTVAPDGTPSPRLRARLDAALAACRQGWAPVILVSGGTGVEGFDEARAMGDYLRQHGVPSSAVVEDGAGVDTEATAIHTATYLRAHGRRRALVVTQYFHVPRTELLLGTYGVDVVGRVHARFVAPRDVYSTVREVAALGALYLGGCGTSVPGVPPADGPGLPCRG